MIFSLFEAAMDEVVKDKGLTRHFIAQLSPGDRKRSIHDDITILVLNLQNQAQWRSTTIFIEYKFDLWSSVQAQIGDNYL